MDYRRGDIIKAKLIGVGSVHKGTKYCVIVSNDYANEHGKTLTIVPLTSQTKCSIPTHFNIEFISQSAVLCEQIQTISKEQILSKNSRELTLVEIKKLNKCLRIALGL